jgi:UDP-GlcNAc:undecaprenyl-phosphate GlcNAc-1-phosphate transferase
MLLALEGFLLALAISLFTNRSVIIVAKLKKLFDEPTEDRKIHNFKTPNLGGVGIYTAFIFSTSIILNNQNVTYFNSLISASILIFAVGLKDDLIKVSPTKKFLAQIIAAFIMAYFGNLRITSFYGILGIEELTYPLSMIVTILFSVFIYNAINLIDGVDFLAGGIVFTASLCFCYLFYQLNSLMDATITFIYAGAVLGFLYYNYSPAKTFMGDSGSLLSGFMLSIFAFRFCEINQANASLFKSGPSLAFSILLIPLFDTLRVFILRIMRGKSPFSADNNHIHHRLINLGFSHKQTSCILLSANLIIILFAYLFQSIGNVQLIVFLLILSVLINLLLWNFHYHIKSNGKIRKIYENEEMNKKIKD